MKFSNGCWLFKQGTSCFAPAEVYFSKIEKNKVVLTCPTQHIVSRGDTLGGVNLYITLTSPMEDVIRVQVEHYRGAKKKSPSFDITIDENRNIDASESEDEIVVKSGSMRLVINKKWFGMTFYRGNEKITSSTGRDLGYIKTDWQGLPYDDGLDHDTYMRQMLSTGVDEHIYGTGERFTPFVKNGQSITIWNEDGGTSTEQSYKNIPFYISDKGYGVFVNHPEKVEFEIGTEMITRTQFSVPGERLDYFIINGPSMKDVLKRYTDITGKPALPAPWTFGLWLSTSFTTNYDEETVNRFVDGMFDRDIPLQVFHFDCFWMKDYAWCNFKWDERVFPDPVGMLKRLKAKGLKICCWINSYIGQESELFDEGVAGGYFIMRKDGESVYQWDMWQPGMAIVDFTNPEAVKWFQSKLEHLMDMGVDCFKTDFGERIPTECRYYDGSDPMKMHNYYTYLYNKAVYDVIAKKKGKEEAVLFARSATVGGQKFPVHWGGDCWSDYESMEESLRGGLSLTLSGFGFWSHDIGGFESTSTADVYKRWCAFGLLSTHSRLHGSNSYRVPWAYDDEACEVVSRFAKLKGKLMPYLYRNAIETSKTGVPMMRAMILEFTDDPSVPYLDKQYMLGDSLLVAPVFNDQSLAKFYLPEGKWTNYFTGKVKKGGKWYSEKVPYTEIPLYVRENSILALGKEEKAVYDYEDGVTLKVYELGDGKSAETTVYDGRNKERCTAKVSRSGNEYAISIKGDCLGCVEIEGKSVKFAGDLETSINI